MYKNIILRIFLGLLVAGFWYSGWVVLASIVTVLYAFRYTAYELVVLGWCLDVQFMTGSVPYYTIVSAGFFVCVEWLKPRLLAYTT